MTSLHLHMQVGNTYQIKCQLLPMFLMLLIIITVWSIDIFLSIYSFLATGDSYNSFSTRFQLGVSTIQSIITDTCDIIWDVLQPVYMPEPTRQDWINISNQFYTRWNFANCLGALDRKHIIMTAPAKSGSLFYNIKGVFQLI